MQPFFWCPKANNESWVICGSRCCWNIPNFRLSEVLELSILVSSWKSQVDESFADFLTFRSVALRGTDILNSSKVVLIPVRIWCSFFDDVFFTLANTWTEDRGQQPLLGGANPIWIRISFVYIDHRSKKLSTLCFSPVKCHLRLTMSHEEFLPFWVVWLINLEFHWGLIKWARFQNKKCLCLWAHALFLDIYSIYTTILHIYIYSNFFVW